ncbi:monovalent cation/H(+) antiporter subunit G [Psychroflexus sediminis]|uniref:Multisubunit sodium/proton antiporter, MrpG subunit n=1 Tax=Psychroflexus sediminis TaxID=470826 RepID=A0A1G7TZ99_9FLAO|nr:monovalent cation/H(+) antiporter subunit G [Psychroflexus sediminis]SDG40606.1 multisubunit sodium/proton antiporter, MrpG subunit [Psychroflexus sediminis]
MNDILVYITSGLGALFVLLAAIGTLRMPDQYLRISVNTKAATLGVGLLLTAAALFFLDLSVTTRVIAVIIFIFITAPVSAHLIGRTSYFIGNKLWENSYIDDLKGKYNKSTHELKGINQREDNEEETEEKS